MSSVAGIFLWWKLLFPLGQDPKTTEVSKTLSSNSVGLFWLLMEGLSPSHCWLGLLCFPCTLGHISVPGKNCWWKPELLNLDLLGIRETDQCELCAVILLKNFSAEEPQYLHCCSRLSCTKQNYFWCIFPPDAAMIINYHLHKTRAQPLAKFAAKDYSRILQITFGWSQVHPP